MKEPSVLLPKGDNQDRGDNQRLRHARERNNGFQIGRYLQPPPMLFTRDGHNLFLGDMYRGQMAFLICAGPSLKTHDLNRLNQRGILTLAVNNAAAIWRPHLWCSVDDPGNFSDAIWCDPSILKFVPLCHMEKTFTVRNEDEELVSSTDVVGDMPAVFGFRRNEAFNADQWLYEDTFNWGNHGNKRDSLGNKGSRSVFLVALRLLFYLGVRRVYLLGCDFRMTYGAQNYAFDQDRSLSSVKGNNNSYRILNSRLELLKPHFAKEQFEVFNCTENSGLTVFPYVSFDEAIEETIGAQPSKIITSGMYDRNSEEKKHEENQKLKPITFEQTKSSQAIESALPLPEFTVVIPLDKQSAKVISHTWKTWCRSFPAIQEAPCLLIHSDGTNPKEILPESLRRNPRLRCVAGWDESSPLPREKQLKALLDPLSKLVATPWYLKLDPETIACGAQGWPNHDWFKLEQTGKAAAFIAPPWGYTKPANSISILDDWGDTIPNLREHPRLDLQYEENDDRVFHDAISTWCMWGNTEWIREITCYLETSPPEVSLATFLYYCAARRNDPAHRIQFKDQGWDHSFLWKPEEIIRLATNVLSATNCE